MAAMLKIKVPCMSGGTLHHIAAVKTSHGFCTVSPTIWTSIHMTTCDDAAYETLSAWCFGFPCSYANLFAGFPHVVIMKCVELSARF